MKSLHTACKFVIALGAASLIVACGGGGGSSGGGGGSSSLNLPITVATGAPVKGAAVVVVDAQGNKESCPGTTADDGTLTCTLTRAINPPYLINASLLNNNLYAVLPSAANVISVNVTPISSVMAQKFATDSGTSPEEILGQPSKMTSTTAGVAQNAVDVVNAIVRAVASTAGITVNNALTQGYTASQTDSLDQVLHNFVFSTTSNGVNISIPTASGVVTVSVTITNATSTTQATADVTNQTSGVTASFTDSQQIDAVVSTFVSGISSCTLQAQQSILNVIEQRPNGAPTYWSGQAVADWVSNNVCGGNPLGQLSTVYSRKIAMFNDKAVYQFGLKNASNNVFEVVLGLSKASGSWKILPDNLPVNTSIKTRHALSYDINTTQQTTSLKYSRYLDAWVDSTRTVTNAIPDKLVLYVTPISNAETAWSATGFSSLTPVATLYRTANCQGALYTLDSTRNSCNSRADDSAYASLFTQLESNDYMLMLVKTVDVNNVCQNCELNGVPISGEIIGKAYTFTQLFGTSLSEQQLRSGVPSFSVQADFSARARTYFAAPSDTDLTNLTNILASNTLSATSITVPWVRPTLDGRQVQNIWAGLSQCGVNGGWVSFPDVRSTSITPTNAYTFTYPVQGKTLGNASYLSFTLANSINSSEFAFYLTASRSNICTL